MLAEDRVCEIVEVRLTLHRPILLGVFSGCSVLGNAATLALDTRLRLARFGETETFKATLRWWKKHFVDFSFILNGLSPSEKMVLSLIEMSD